MSVYATIKHRPRSTKAEMEARHDALWQIVMEMAPCSVRQVFYQASVRGLVEKSEDGYKRVQRDLTTMRRAGRLTYSAITDNTRWQRRPATYRDISEALAETARFYRKALWTDAKCHVEVWLEKDALSGSLYPVTSEYDVPLMVARGYASLTFLWSSAEYLQTLDVPAYTRPTKRSDSRSKKFGSKVSVELDAIEPNMLRDMVRTLIERHLPRQQFEVLMAAEKSERELLHLWVRKAGWI
jgi:hypothetical protein